jgi:hypothetical protein
MNSNEWKQKTYKIIQDNLYYKVNLLNSTNITSYQFDIKADNGTPDYQLYKDIKVILPISIELNYINNCVNVAKKKG